MSSECMYGNRMFKKLLKKLDGDLYSPSMEKYLRMPLRCLCMSNKIYLLDMMANKIFQKHNCYKISYMFSQILIGK
jgi:hypothetical protein